MAKVTHCTHGHLTTVQLKISCFLLVMVKLMSFPVAASTFASHPLFQTTKCVTISTAKTHRPIHRYGLWMDQTQLEELQLPWYLWLSASTRNALQEGW